MLLAAPPLVSELHCTRMSGASSRQAMVADEMFPDGPGPLDYVDVEDGVGAGLGSSGRGALH